MEIISILSRVYRVWEHDNDNDDFVQKSKKKL